MAKTKKIKTNYAINGMSVRKNQFLNFPKRKMGQTLDLSQEFNIIISDFIHFFILM